MQRLRSARKGRLPFAISKTLSGIRIPPRKRMTVPASEDTVRILGSRKGMWWVSADLSGL